MNRLNIPKLEELRVVIGAEGSCELAKGKPWCLLLMGGLEFADADNKCTVPEYAGSSLCKTTTVYKFSVPHQEALEAAARDGKTWGDIYKEHTPVAIFNEGFAKSSHVMEEEEEEEKDAVIFEEGGGSGTGGDVSAKANASSHPAVAIVEVAAVRISTTGQGQSPIAGFAVGVTVDREFHPCLLNPVYTPGVCAIIEALMMDKDGAMPDADAFKASAESKEMGDEGRDIYTRVQEAHTILSLAMGKVVVSRRSPSLRRKRVGAGGGGGAGAAIALPGKVGGLAVGRAGNKGSGGSPEAISYVPLQIDFDCPQDRLLANILMAFCSTPLVMAADGVEGAVQKAVESVMTNLKQYGDGRDRVLVSTVKIHLFCIKQECDRMRKNNELGVLPQIAAHAYVKDLKAVILRHGKDGASSKIRDEELAEEEEVPGHGRWTFRTQF